MNIKRSAILVILSLAAGYLLGFYQVTPAYLYSLSTKPEPSTTKTPQVEVRTLTPRYAPASSAETQPTPYPPPDDWRGR